MIIDDGICFECGGAPVEMHHIVPRSMGGTRTLPLCHSCHGKIHDVKRSVNHRALVKKGLAAAAAKGVKGGRKKGYKHTAETRDKMKATHARHRAPIDPLIAHVVKENHNDGLTLQAIAAKLNDAGCAAPMGGEFVAIQVKRVIERLGLS